MKIRYILFGIFMALHVFLFMIPTAQDIEKGKRELNINLSQGRIQEKGNKKFILNHGDGIEMLDEIDQLFKAHDLIIGSRRLSTQTIQGMNRTSFQLNFVGGKSDVEKLLGEKLFLEKRYRLHSLNMEQSSIKVDEEIKEENSVEPKMIDGVWMGEIVLYTYMSLQ